MSEEFNIRVTEDGLVSANPIPTDQERESKLDEILALINDPDTAPARSRGSSPRRSPRSTA